MKKEVRAAKRKRTIFNVTAKGQTAFLACLRASRASFRPWSARFCIAPSTRSVAL
jgi:hypothetical protein